MAFMRAVLVYLAGFAPPQCHMQIVQPQQVLHLHLKIPFDHKAQVPSYALPMPWLVGELHRGLSCNILPSSQ